MIKAELINKKVVDYDIVVGECHLDHILDAVTKFRSAAQEKCEQGWAPVGGIQTSECRGKFIIAQAFQKFEKTMPHR